MEKAAKFIIKLGLCARYHSKCFSYIKPFNPVKENSELDSKVAKADLLRSITTGGKRLLGGTGFNSEYNKDKWGFIAQEKVEGWGMENH